MYYVDKWFDEDFYHSKIFSLYFNDLKIGVMDIETTGLNPDSDKIILGGLLIPHNSGVKTMQFFSETNNEESTLLDEYLSELNNVDVLISYNGNHFDLPFINKRLVKNRIRQNVNTVPFTCLPLHQSFDLYRIADQYSNLRKLLPNLKQKTVETFMGLWSDRTDQISGAESVELYNQYLRTGSPLIRDTILLHNIDDILQLSRLLKILDKLDLHKIMFHSGFVVSNIEKKLFIKKIEVKKDHLSISGLHKNIHMDYHYYGISHEAKLSREKGDFSLKISSRTINNCIYIDLDEFKFDCNVLEKYPGYHSGYLVIKDSKNINYAEINHLIRIILKDILEEF